MTCNTCPRAKAAVLHDGREVCTYCEAWRHECEARAVLDMPNIEHRRKYLAGVGNRRGRKAQFELETTVRAIWEARRRPAAE